MNICIYGTLAVGIEAGTYYLLIERTCSPRRPKKQYEKKAALLHILILELFFWTACVRGRGISYLAFWIPFLLYPQGFVVIQMTYIISIFRNILLTFAAAAQSILVRAVLLTVIRVHPEMDDVYLMVHQFRLTEYTEAYFLIAVGLFLFLYFFYAENKYEKYIYSVREKSILFLIFIQLLVEGICCVQQNMGKGFLLPVFVQATIVLFLLTESYIMKTYQRIERERFQADIQNQMIYYEGIEKNQQEVYKLYHDMKNHLIALETLEGEQKNYISQCLERIEATEGQAQSGIAYVDVLLNEKWKKAQEEKIDMNFSIEKEALEGIELFDLTVLFGNLLDNALEAAKKVTDARAYVAVKCGKKGSCIFLQVINDYKEEPVEKEGEFQTKKAEKKYHGLGFKNVKDVVRKYGGEIRTEYKEGKFRVVILLDAGKK